VTALAYRSLASAIICGRDDIGEIGAAARKVPAPSLLTIKLRGIDAN
jgi:hypothetical protein